MFNPQLIHKAIKFAQARHAGQTRKVSGDEYFQHPIEASYICANFKKSKSMDVLIAALILHDTVEDTETTFEELLSQFGMFVASLVFELTDDKALKEKLGKFEYQKAKWCGISNYALFLKLCDRLSNITDSPTETAKSQTKELLNHISSKRKLTKSQKEVVKEIRKYI